MKIAMVAPECYGHAMVGGLAMAVSGLAKALQKKGDDVRLILPAYCESMYSDKFVKEPSKKTHKTPIEIGEKDVDGLNALILEFGLEYSGMTYTDSSPDIKETVYRRSNENIFSSAFTFAEAVPKVLEKLRIEKDWVPDVIHLHEWQAAPAAYYLKQSEKFSNTPVVLTTHNARYIGEVPFSFQTPRGVPYRLMEIHTVAIKIEDALFKSLLEMGKFFSDAVTTVSPTYAQEVLDGSSEVNKRVARRMKEKGLEGILNGVDYELMDPQSDPSIVRFNTDDMESFAYGKGMNKVKLHRCFGITPNEDVMQISMMSRLVKQKGIDVVMEALDEISSIGEIQLLIVGETDDNALRERLECLTRDKVRITPYFAGPQQQHLVLAGSDAILMPSRYEPCGLTQLEGMRYGAVPIVTHVGGLKDTVVPFNKDTGAGYGFVINELSPEGIVTAINEAHKAFQDKKVWLKAVRNALAANFAWDGPNDSVGKYMQLYERLLNSK